MQVQMPYILVLSQFGARSNATNSIEDVAELVKYAHLFKAPSICSG
jgi:collagenase-like PrtC family protease